MYIALLIAIIIFILIIIILILALRKPYTINSPLFFIHIPKNAGTTINYLGLKNGYRWTYRSENMSCSAWHIPPDKNLDRPSFCVVRNPYDRIISQYSYSRSKKELNDYIRDKLTKYIKNRHIDDCHFIPQHKYTKYITHVLKYENLEKEFNSLMEEYDINITLNEKKNVTVHKYKIEDISRESLDLINSVYRKDFLKLSYNTI